MEVFCWYTWVQRLKGAIVKHPVVCLALLFSSLTLAAQNGGKTDGHVPVFRGIPVGNECPISMRASQAVWDHLVAVKKGFGNQKFGQRILLTLVDSPPAPIVSAAIKVRGLTGKNQIMQAGSGNADGDGVKTLNITFMKNRDGSVYGDLYAPGFTSVSSVDLLEVSYDDGRVWRIGGSNVCRVKPDPVMLIAAH